MTTVAIPYDLMSESDRSRVEPVPSTPRDNFDARRMAHREKCDRFEKLVRTVRWFDGEQPRTGHGPVGRCLVAWTDAYPLAVFPDAGSPEYCPTIVSGHYSGGGSCAVGAMLNMLAFVAANPGGRTDSDSRWLRKGGKEAYFAFHGADPTSKGRTLVELLADPSFHAAPEDRSPAP